ncbi:hypothetical protein [Desulfosporosinus sp. FKA]|uniref:hypothetical protein n=1 Tax=Desulfosporosinus sp. FKA TaxID=1969834 RepID=UPI000B4A3D00|nr:hypothetical protein [Desulfosporosinus sp. FKA]
MDYDNDNKKMRIGIWLILLFLVVVVTYYWQRFEFNFLNFIQFWLMGLVLAYALVFILHKIIKLWKVPIVIIGLNLIFHFLYGYSGDGVIALYFVKILFILLTLLFTIWIYIFNKLKGGIVE